jgi:O-antigen/teichoic acid export membrane protein
MSKLDLIKGSAGYFLSNITNRVLGFLFVVIATRSVGASGYGLIALGLTVKGLTNNFGLFGLSFSSQKYLSGKYNINKRKYFGSMLYINIVIALFSFLILFFGNEYIAINFFNKPEFSLVLKLFSFAIVLGLPMSLLRAVLKAQKKVKLYFYTNLIESSSKLISLMLILVIHNKIVAISLAILISSLCGFLASVQFIYRENLIPQMKFDFDLVYTVLKTGSQFLLVGLGYYLVSQTDRLMLGSLSTSESLGIYAVSASLAQIPGTLHGSMVAVFMPTVSELFKEENYDLIKENYKFLNYLIGSINITIVIFYIIFGQEILFYLFNFEGEKIYYVFLLLSLKYLFGTLIGPTSSLLNMMNKHKVELFNTLIMLVVNVVLNYFLIIHYDVYGAVVGTLISVILLNFMQIIQIYINFKFWVFNKNHIIMILPLVFFGGSYFLLDEYLFYNFYNRITLFLASEILFIIIIYYFLDENYKNKFKNKLSDFWRKLNEK